MNGALVVVGSINADLVLEIDRLPRPGETLQANSFETFPGGKVDLNGANQAAAAAKLGYPTFLIGQIGSDSNGNYLKESLSSVGVNLSFVKTIKDPTGTAIIMLQPSGENSIMIVGGANQASWKLTSATNNLICTAAAILLQREIPDSVNESVARMAFAASIPVIMDAGGVDRPLSSTIFPYLNVLSPNESELSRLTGMNTSTDTEVEIAARTLLSKGVENVLVKLGSRGSLLISKSEKIRQEAIPVVKIIDTTGAGDCFTSAFVVGLLQDMSKSEALKYASLAASKCIQRKGAMSSLPTQQEIESSLP